MCPPLPLTCSVVVGQSLPSPGPGTLLESMAVEYHCQTRNTSGLDPIGGCRLAARGQIPSARCVGLVCSVFNYKKKKQSVFFLAVCTNGEICNLKFRLSGKPRSGPRRPTFPFCGCGMDSEKLFGRALPLQFSLSPPGSFYPPVPPAWFLWASGDAPLN